MTKDQMTDDLPRGEVGAPIPINFAIVGVQKAATSTMHTLLTKHRLIAPVGQNKLHPGRMPNFGRKELHFFDDETQDWSNPPYDLYHAVRQRPIQQFAGDGTPVYLFWPRALERMHAYNPEMRLIASFRDPIERAVSQWSMARKTGRPYPDFAEAIVTLDDESLMHQIPAGAEGWYVHRHSLVPRGLYGAQLERGLDIFDRSQWLMINFRDYVSDYTTVLDQMTDHLGMHRFRSYPEHRTNPTPRDQIGEPIAATDIQRLVGRYADDLDLFTRLSGVDTSAWPTRQIAEGNLDSAALAEKLSRKIGLID